MKLIFVLGVQIVLVYGQPIFTPMAGHVGVPVGAHVGAPAMGGHFGLPIDTLGAASGYAGGGAGFPLLSPMELNAIMEAQARGGNFKAAFTPDTEPQGFAGYGQQQQQQQQQHGGFMPNFEDGFGQEGNSEFYEAPHHGEPFPAHEADSDVKQPEPKGRDNRDNRGPYHKDDAIEDEPSSEGPQEPQEPREVVNGRGGQVEPSNGHPGQQRGYREEERDSGEPQIQNEPALRGAYREYRGEGGSPSNDHPRQRGGYRDEERDSGEVSSQSGQNEPNSRGAYREYRGEGGHNNNGQSEGAEGQEGADGPESFVGGHDQRENYNYQ